MKKFYIILVAMLRVKGFAISIVRLHRLPQAKLLSSIFFTDANTGHAVGLALSCNAFAKSKQRIYNLQHPTLSSMEDVYKVSATLIF